MPSRDNQISALVVELLRDEFDTYIRSKKVPTKLDRRQPPSEKQVNRANVVISAFTGKLNSLAEDEFKKLLDNKHALIVESERARDLVRFFNQPDADIDYTYWGQLSYWTEEEAAALITDKNPKVVTRKSLERYLQVSPYGQQFLRAYELISRAVHSYELETPITPLAFSVWADGKKLNIPSELVKAIESCTGYVDWEALYRELHGMNTKLKKYYDELHEKYLVLDETLKAEQAKPQTPAEDQQPDKLSESVYWLNLQSIALEAIKEYPDWHGKQTTKVQTSHILGWLQKTYSAGFQDVCNKKFTEREALVIKYVLQDIHPNIVPSNK